MFTSRHVVCGRVFCPPCKFFFPCGFFPPEGGTLLIIKLFVLYAIVLVCVHDVCLCCIMHNGLRTSYGVMSRVVVWLRRET